MANFDLDDPLGDLLSDGSNDSFFDDHKDFTKKSNLTTVPNKKGMSELFDKAKSDSKEISWLDATIDTTKNITQEKVNFSPKNTKKPVTKISFEDEDILSNLRSDHKSDLNHETKKSENTRKSITESTLKASNENDILFDNILTAGKSSKKSEIITQPLVTSYQSSSFEHQREGRRSQSQQSQGFTDFLGLFPTTSRNTIATDIDKSVFLSPTKKIESTVIGKPATIHNTNTSKTVPTEVLFTAPANRDMKPKSAPNISTFPDWLQEKSVVDVHKSDTVLQTQTEKKPIDDIVYPQNFQTTDLNKSRVFHTLEEQQQLTTCDMEFQAASFSMQHQDMQLLTALHLKKYEENLVMMQRKQQELLSKQEKQFHSLLERQLAKQQILENNMQMQQERINSHIQLLLSQSSINNMSLPENVDQIYLQKKTTNYENMHFHDELINSLKQKSQEEKLLLEESCRKQISTLENTMESVEHRLKIERDSILENHKLKYDQMKQEYDAEIEKYKEKIEEMSVIHSNELKSIRKNHDQIIDEIKYEYSTLIENIKQTKQYEGALFQNSLNYSQKLDASMHVLDTNAKLLTGVREKVNNDYNILSMAREESIKAKEEEIQLLRETLEKARVTVETERSQLLALIRSLENKLNEQNQNAQEERWIMQQATTALVTRSAVLEREGEFNKACLERERDQLKTLKESLLAEKEATILQLQEEKLALSAERARLETSIKLGSNNYDNQRVKAEIDAAMEVAKKAAALTDIERSNLQVVQCEVETLKRSLIDREHKVDLREKEFQSIMQIADKKCKDGEEALAQAKTLQRDYNQKLKDIQNQLVSLTIREKKLAEDKISLSKERQAIQNQMRQAKRFSLCAIDTVPCIEEYDYSQ